MVEHLPHHPKVKGLSPATAADNDFITLYVTQIALRSKVARHLPHHPKVNGLSPAAVVGSEIEENFKKYIEPS